MHLLNVSTKSRFILYDIEQTEYLVSLKGNQNLQVRHTFKWKCSISNLMVSSTQSPKSTIRKPYW